MFALVCVYITKQYMYIATQYTTKQAIVLANQKRIHIIEVELEHLMSADVNITRK